MSETTDKRIEELKKKIQMNSEEASKNKSVALNSEQLYAIAKRANDEQFKGIQKMLKANETDVIKLKKDLSYLIKMVEEFLLKK